MPARRRLPVLPMNVLERLAAAGLIAALVAGCTNGGGGGFSYPPVAATPPSAPSPAPSAAAGSGASTAPASGTPVGSAPASSAPATSPGSSPAASPGSSPSGGPAPSGSPSAGGTPGASPSPTTSAPAAIPPLTAALPQTPTLVSTKPCPGSAFTCITLAVPRDHFTAGGPTWDVTFALKKAAKVRRGVFVTITGGPGSSGLASADDYTSSFESGVTDYNDIVFLDQRGVGLSQPLGCPVATAAYYQTDNNPIDPAQFDGAASDAQTYVAACLAETKVNQADLPYYSTRQAVEDLEAFREYLGVDKIALYGESYGTQYVQTYAAAHPDHVASLFVDGPVDLTVDAPTFFREEVRAFDDSLTATLVSCDDHKTCRTDALGTTIAGYDALRTKLLAAPIPVRFPTAKGTFVTRQLTPALLDNAAAGYVYSQFSRMLLQRAITEATRGDYVPLMRLAYDSLVIDPDTLATIPDPTYSDAMYYAVECQDYAYYPTAGDPTARLHAWVADGQAAGIGSLRLSTTYFGDLPCLWWPNTPTVDPRVPALGNEPFPTFVLTATLDPATPIVDAMRIYGRLTNAYLYVQTGGPHVIFGRGLSCPDDAISAFLAGGSLPTTRITVCNGAVADPYVANPLPRASAYRTARQFAASVEQQLLNTDDYNYRWDGQTPMASGCDFGGTMTYRAVSGGTRVDLHGCTLTRGLPMTGSATLADSGAFVLTIKINGHSLHFDRNAAGAISLSGTIEGKTAG